MSIAHQHPSSSPDKSGHTPTVSSLLAMAEHFLSVRPQRVQEGVHCLLAGLALHPPPRIEARARLQLGLVLYHHSNNLLEAREHLDKAMLVAQSAANLEDVRFEATSVAGRILVTQNCLHQAKSLLKGRLDGTAHFPYWHIRLLLQLVDIHVSERDESAVLSVLNKCADYTQQVNAPYTRLLCFLYKGAYLLTHRHYQEAGEVLNTCNSLLEAYRGDKATLLKTFYLVIQVTHLLMAGQVKLAKPHLKQLQQCVKTLSAEDESSLPSASAPPAHLTAESFEWLSHEQTYAIVYLVSMMHSVQAGYTDKALSYADKALQLLHQQKDCGVVSVLKAHLLEHVILCLLVQGKSVQAVDRLHEAVTVCHSHPQLVYSHRAVLHTLLGLYAFATDSLERTVAQFHTALQHSNNTDLRMFVSLNLAVTYMKIGEEKDAELHALMQSLESDCPSNNSCQSLRAAGFYVKGLHSLYRLKIHEAKRHLREALVMSNGGDLNKLTTCSLILLGQIFLSLGNTKETTDMVSPAMQLASKIPDKRLQVWAASLLAELYRLSGDRASEQSAREQSSKAQKDIQEGKREALRSPHNTLVQWTVGEWPVAMAPSSVLQPHLEAPHSSTSSIVTPVELPPTTVAKRGRPMPHTDSLTEGHVTDSESEHNQRALKHEARPYQLGGDPMEVQQSFVKQEVVDDSPKVEKRRHPSTQLGPSSRPDHLVNDSTPPRRKLSTSSPLAQRHRVRNTPPALSLKSSHHSELSSPRRESPNHDSLIFKGSPVSLKMPEIRLNKVESPIRSQASTNGKQTAGQLFLGAHEQECKSRETPVSEQGGSMPVATPDKRETKARTTVVDEQEVKPRLKKEFTEAQVTPMDTSAHVLPTHHAPSLPITPAPQVSPQQQVSHQKPHPQTPPPPYLASHSTGVEMSPYRRAVPAMSLPMGYDPHAMLQVQTSPPPPVSASTDSLRARLSPHIPQPHEPHYQQHQEFSPSGLAGRLQSEQIGSPLQGSSPPSHRLPSSRLSPHQVAQSRSPQFPAVDQHALLQQQLYHKQQLQHQQQLQQQQQFQQQQQLQQLQQQQLQRQQQLQQIQMQQQLAAQQQMLQQQHRSMLQQTHYSPQKLQHSHTPATPPRLATEQPHLLQQQQSAFQQQQMMLAQQSAAARAQQHYLYQQAAMMLPSHSPRPVSAHPGIPRYYINPGPAMVPPSGASGGASPSKQSPQPQLTHVNTLQRMGQEPSRSSLGMSPHGQPLMLQMPTLNRLGNPYVRSIQLAQTGGTDGSTPTLGSGPLSHFNPHGGHMPGQ